MLIKSIRDGFINVHVINNFLIDLFDSIIEEDFGILYDFFLMVHRLTQK